MQCKICEQRKPRRYCPGVTGEICSICCGNEREQTIDCPLDCPHLQDAHDHERLPAIDSAQIPNRDIQCPDDFPEENETLMNFVLALVLSAALDTQSAIDSDLGDALAGVIRTLRTRAESGLYYECRPENTIGASIYVKIRDGIEKLRKQMASQRIRLPDSQLIAAFVYVQRGILLRGNGRRKCRVFMDTLHRMFPEAKPTGSRSLLIVP